MYKINIYDMKHLKRYNKIQESTTFYDKNGVYIEPLASSSDFYKFIDSNKGELGFDSDEFHSKMLRSLFSEGNLSSRYTKEHCNSVINGTAGKYWRGKEEYYKAILLLMERYELETIRFACDW